MTSAGARGVMPGLLLALVSLVTADSAEMSADSPGDSSHAPAASPKHPRDSAPPGELRLDLVWLDSDGLLTPDQARRAREEAGAIFRRIGIEIRWTRVEAGEEIPGDATRQVVVVPLGSPPGTTPLPEHTMGAVPADPGPPYMVWAYVDNIRAALSRRPDGSDASGSPSGDELAKAVGRVVAHEVIHAVAAEHPHGPGGLMNATLSSRALLEPVLEVSPVCACAAAEGVARLQLGAGPRDGPATDCGEQ